MATVRKYGDEWVKPGTHCDERPLQADRVARVNDRLSLEKNLALLEMLRARFVEQRILTSSRPANAMAALNFFTLGEADLMMDKGLTPVSLMNELKTKPYFHSSTFLGTYFMRFNCAKNSVHCRSRACARRSRSSSTSGMWSTKSPAQANSRPRALCRRARPVTLHRPDSAATRTLRENCSPRRATRAARVSRM